MNRRETRILVVEDDETLRETLAEVLVDEGHVVRAAAHGDEALDHLDGWVPDVILLDLMMPIMDGLTFLAEKRKRALAEDVPVLCVTAGGDEMQRHALDLGARECLHKPADFDELCSRVDHYCRSPRA